MRVHVGGSCEWATMLPRRPRDLPRPASGHCHVPRPATTRHTRVTRTRDGYDLHDLSLRRSLTTSHSTGVPYVFSTPPHPSAEATGGPAGGTGRAPWGLAPWRGLGVGLGVTLLAWHCRLDCSPHARGCASSVDITMIYSNILRSLHIK